LLNGTGANSNRHRRRGTEVARSRGTIHSNGDATFGATALASAAPRSSINSKDDALQDNIVASSGSRKVCGFIIGVHI